MFFAKNTVDKKFADIAEKTPTVFVALRKDLRVKVSPAMHAIKGEPYHILFGELDGGYLPKNGLEVHILRQRQKVQKDVVELSKEVIQRATAAMKKPAEASKDSSKKDRKKEK